MKERKVEMKEVKKFTCLDHEGNKPEGAIEGTKAQVLAWMKKKFPRIRKAADQDLMPAWQFFYKGETTTYETQDRDNLYLTEVDEEWEVATDKKAKEDSKEEKKLEKALKDYRRNYAKKHPEWAKKEAARAKMMDEEVAEEVSKVIWETAHLRPWEQAEKINEMCNGRSVLHWRILSSSWFAADVANRIFSHDEKALKDLLCEDLPVQKNDDAKCLAGNIRRSRFIHFQMTKAFNGGFDVYIVFRLPKSDTVIIRLEYA